MKNNTNLLTTNLLFIVAHNVKLFRKAQKLTQDDLACKMGIYREGISRIELGKHDIKLSTLEKLAVSLNVPVASLVELK